MLAVLVVAGAVPGVAHAHSTITVQGADVTYFSEDAISDNCLIIDETETELRFYDQCADAGLQASTQCRPGNKFDSAGNPVEVFCPRTGIRNVNVDLGPNEDKMTANVSEILTAAGGSGTDNLVSLGGGNDILVGDQGNDTLAAGEGNDDLRGGEGNDILRGEGGDDKLQGSSGADELDAGAGNDSLQSQDGVQDKLTCGDGTDTAAADSVDTADASCETVTRATVAPPAEQPAADDKTRPKIAVGGSTLQRVSMKRRRIYVAATSSEKGEIVASGFLDAGGINTALRAKPKAVTVAGGGVELVFTLSKTAMKKVMRDLARGRKVYARINVVATDRAGNSTNARVFKIRLRK